MNTCAERIHSSHHSQWKSHLERLSDDDDELDDDDDDDDELELEELDDDDSSTSQCAKYRVTSSDEDELETAYSQTQGWQEHVSV